MAPMIIKRPCTSYLHFQIKRLRRMKAAAVHSRLGPFIRSLTPLGAIARGRRHINATVPESQAP